ncbi:DUF1772 domain-containing protein [Streptomyces sp. NPDC057702]|uniref:anthrone oxygenase family protein n=1 Tax=unclassified Streptomyces TaxID=2593676 RepID=UPI0036B3CC1B
MIPVQLKTLHTAALLAGTLTTGLMAGLFAAFSYAVMPGLGGASDRAFVEAMQKINTAILNGWFMSCFLGGLAFTALALALNLRSGADRSALPWIIAGLALYLAMFVITSAVNVPLNDELAKAGDPAHIADLADVRRDFESRWVTWNTVRTVTNVAAFAVLAWALVLHGRGTPPEPSTDATSAVARTTEPVAYGAGLAPRALGPVAYGAGPGLPHTPGTPTHGPRPTPHDPETVTYGARTVAPGLGSTPYGMTPTPSHSGDGLR